MDEIRIISLSQFGALDQTERNIRRPREREYLLRKHIHEREWKPVWTTNSGFSQRKISALYLSISISIIIPYPISHILDPLDSHRSLGIQRIRVAIVTLLLAILQPTALVILQHPMLAAEMPLAERAITHYPLRAVLAVFEGAFYLLGGHAAADGQGHVESRGWW